MKTQVSWKRVGIGLLVACGAISAIGWIAVTLMSSRYDEVELTGTSVSLTPLMDKTKAPLEEPIVGEANGWRFSLPGVGTSLQRSRSGGLSAKMGNGDLLYATEDKFHVSQVAGLRAETPPLYPPEVTRTPCTFLHASMMTTPRDIRWYHWPSDRAKAFSLLVAKSLLVEHGDAVHEISTGSICGFEVNGYFSKRPQTLVLFAYDTQGHGLQIFYTPGPHGGQPVMNTIIASLTPPQ